MKLILPLLLFVSLIQTIGQAQDWTQEGIGAQQIGEIVTDRHHHGLLFVTIPGESRTLVARSTDNGKTWKQVDFQFSVYQVLIHPQTSEVLVITAPDNTSFRGAEFWISKDHGETFELRATSTDYFDLERSVWDRDSSVLYNFFYSLRRSTDSGRTWTNLKLWKQYQDCKVRRWYNNDLVSINNSIYLSAEAYHPGCNNKGSYSSLLLRSTDQGESWKRIHTFPHSDFDPDEVRFDWDAAFPQRLLMHGTSGIWQLTEHGVRLLNSMYVDSVISVPDRPQELAAITSIGFYQHHLWRSSDSGQTWIEDKDNLNGSIHVLHASSKSPNAFVAGTAIGLFTKDQTHNWTQSNNRIPRSEPVRVTSLAKSASKLYMVTYDRFLYRKNGSERWKSLYTRYHLTPEEEIQRVVTNPNDAAHVLLLGTSQYGNGTPLILISKDSGEHWTRSSIQFTEGSPQAYINPGDRNLVYLWTQTSAYKSNDGGLTGEPLSLPSYTTQIVADPSNHLTLYIVAYRLFKSYDGGKTSQPVHSAPGSDYVSRIEPLPKKDSYVLALRGGIIFTTLDAGNKWQRMGTVELDPENHCEHPYWCSPIDLRAENENHYFLISAFGGFFESTDAGRNWTEVNPFPSRFSSIYEMTDPKVQPFYIGAANGAFRNY